MKKRYGKELKEEVLSKIRFGKKVRVVAESYGINEQTVRNWLRRDTEGGSSEILELSRLRRENEALYRLVGQLTFESDRDKKNQRRGKGR